ncbi:MAG: hypothetical protein NZ585_05770 [Chloracidobacterium sp.]|nr:hypothetical protein [Chloracidobacterium sp.]MDW8217575.1 hypothetical protein [Acidobacteriota bacterium]
MKACLPCLFGLSGLTVLRCMATGWVCLSTAILVLSAGDGFAQTTRPATKRRPSRTSAPEHRPPKPTETAPRPQQDKYPPVEARVAAYREQLEAKKIKREDTQPYLIDGVEVLGISETARGYTAFIRVEDNTTLVVRPGMRFYDGVIERIEPGRILFRLNNRRLVEKRYGRPIDAAPDQTSPEQPPEQRRFF